MLDGKNNERMTKLGARDNWKYHSPMGLANGIAKAKTNEALSGRNGSENLARDEPYIFGFPWCFIDSILSILAWTFGFGSFHEKLICVKWCLIREHLFKQHVWISSRVWTGNLPKSSLHLWHLSHFVNCTLMLLFLNVVETILSGRAISKTNIWHVDSQNLF